MSFEHLKQKLSGCDYVFYKVLSSNDKSWSWDKDRPGYSHQGGVVVPAEVCGLMFPKKEADEGTGPDFIPSTSPRSTGYYGIDMLWDDDGTWEKCYSGGAASRRTKFGRSYKDRDESRITAGLNKEMFKNAPSGAIIVIARDAKALAAGRYVYYYDIYAPDDNDYLAFLEYFGFSQGFDYQYQDITAVSLPTAEELRELIEAYQPAAVLEEKQKVNQLAKMAWDTYMADNGLADPEHIFIGESKPGNIIQELWELGHEVLKGVQKITCPFEVMKLVITEAGKPNLDIDDLMKVLAERFEEIRRLFVGVNQSVSSIAGKAFEKHIELWLFSNDIPYLPQPRLDDRKIPDFVLPSREFYLLDESVRKPDDAMLLSAKTTLRERWSQILLEGKGVKTRYLLTLDKSVSSDIISEMKGNEAFLVVTENDKGAHYKNEDNAISFKELHEVISKTKKSCEDRMLLWLPPKDYVQWWL